MKYNFDNEWYLSEKNIGGKNKLVLNSSNVLSSALSRTVNNPEAKDHSLDILNSDSLYFLYNPNKSIFTTLSGTTLVCNKWLSQSGKIFSSDEIDSDVEDIEYPLYLRSQNSNFNLLKYTNDRSTTFKNKSGVNKKISLDSDFTYVAGFYLDKTPSGTQVSDQDNSYLYGTFSGTESLIRSSSVSELEIVGINGSGTITHESLTNKEFHVVSVMRSGTEITARLDSVDCSGTVILDGSFYFDFAFYKSFVRTAGFALYDSYIDELLLRKTEDTIKLYGKNHSKKLKGIQYHAIGLGDPNWDDSDYSSGISTSASGLVDEIQREIPYYCKFIEDYVSTAQSGSVNLIIDSTLENFKPSDLESKIVYVGSGTNAGYSGIISYSLEPKILSDDVGNNKIYLSTDFPDNIDNTSVYEIRNLPVSGTKITNKVHLKTSFTNNTDNDYTITEHGLFGGDATSTINSGILFNHVMISGTNQIDYSSGNSIELEFVMKLV